MEIRLRSINYCQHELAVGLNSINIYYKYGQGE